MIQYRSKFGKSICFMGKWIQFGFDNVYKTHCGKIIKVCGRDVYLIGSYREWCAEKKKWICRDVPHTFKNPVNLGKTHPIEWIH